MLKRYFVIILLLSFILSCEKDDKCLSCSYNLSGQEIVLTGDNLCGDDTALDAVEQAFIDDAIAAGANTDDISCSRE